MNRKEKLKMLKEAAYEVICEEKLPTPKNIRYRSPLNGNMKRMGVCQRTREGDYSILINTTIANFVPDPSGKYKNNKTGQRMRRIMGIDIKFEDLLKTMGHEIAHLKFFNHGTEHKCYTKHIVNSLKQKLALS